MTEPRRRSNTWIIVFVVLVLACFCLLAAAVVGVGLTTNWSFDLGWGENWQTSQETNQVERSFTLGSAPRLEIDNFAGKVTVQAGAGDTLRVVATKKALGLANLDRIEIDFTEETNGLRIKTRKSVGLNNASVEFEITAPAGTQVDLHTGAGSTDVRGLSGSVTVDTGAGSIDIRDVSGTIDAHTGAGSIAVRGAAGRALLDTGAGSIDYEGRPEGDSRFETGTGSIDLTLPADLNVEVDLDTGVGGISLEFDVAGQVTRREVRGTIGTGADGSIYAHSGTGSIDLKRR